VLVLSIGTMVLGGGLIIAAAGDVPPGIKLTLVLLGLGVMILGAWLRDDFRLRDNRRNVTNCERAPSSVGIEHRTFWFQTMLHANDQSSAPPQ